MDYMDRNKTYVIKPSRLVGSVRVSGAKNSALRLLAASILSGEKVELDNYPAKILDAQIQVEMLKCLGKDCNVQGNKIVISERNKLNNRLDWKGPSIRNTLLVLGALVARTGQGAVPLPGGCLIGERRYDLHEMLLRAMGADVWRENDMLLGQVKGKLKGTDIHLPIRSTGATENAIICGALAEGVTRVWNPHIRPEIIDLVAYLKKMGVDIKVYGQEHIKIKGSENLRSVHHNVIADNVEAITWLIGSMITTGDVEIIDFPTQHLEVPLVFLRESGARFYAGEDRLIVRGGQCFPIDISTGPYPGINSDMQPLFAVYGLSARGESRIIDLRFPGRYRYAEEMKKMGAAMETRGNMLIVNGTPHLKGARVVATDLRAGISLVLAGLRAHGETLIEDAWQIERGYDHFEEKVRALGGEVKCGNQFRADSVPCSVAEHD
ncbi:MAG: UDP-N-acetylglucosamine 1-carboxyvinyltransferase [Thermodesulfobacteriota bacterium]|nr:UDP-N-acetylglucosamine 1-carboxyvinyltransferase [Thermodesulfobacteriota bacterium]